MPGHWRRCQWWLRCLATRAPLVRASVAFFDADVKQLRAIDDLAVAGYLGGLRAAFWRGDARPVRFGYAVAAALRFALIPIRVIAAEPQRAAALEQKWDQRIDAILDRWDVVVAFLLGKADAARALLLLVGAVSVPA